LFVLLVVWGGLILLFGRLSSGFLSTASLGAVANRIPALLLTATGMTLLMVTGGIDLSVGSVLGLCGAIVGVVMVDFGWGLAGAIFLSILLGCLIGGVNGLVSVKLRLPSFIVSLGMLEIRGGRHRYRHRRLGGIAGVRRRAGGGCLRSGNAVLFGIGPLPDRGRRQ